MSWKPFQFDSNDILRKIISTTTDLFYSLPSKFTVQKKTTKLIGWKQPPPGFFKLNTDGSARGNPGGASAMGIIKDANGSWISSCSRKIGHTYSMVAELWGLRDGLTLAKNLNIEKLLVEVDALAIANISSSENVEFDPTHPYSAIIIDCRSLL